MNIKNLYKLRFSNKQSAYSLSYLLILACFLFQSISEAKAYINPDTYNIQIVGDGTTYSKIVKIKAQRQQGDGNGNINWICFPSGELSFNNTGQDSYVSVGASSCINGWSYIDWDITGYDGNVLYGLKKVYIKIFWGNNGTYLIQDFTNRSVFYKEQPTPTPTPASVITPTVAVTTPMESEIIKIPLPTPTPVLSPSPTETPALSPSAAGTISSKIAANNVSPATPRSRKTAATGTVLKTQTSPPNLVSPSPLPSPSLVTQALPTPRVAGVSVSENNEAKKIFIYVSIGLILGFGTTMLNKLSGKAVESIMNKYRH